MEKEEGGGKGGGEWLGEECGEVGYVVLVVVGGGRGGCGGGTLDSSEALMLLRLSNRRQNMQPRPPTDMDSLALISSLPPIPPEKWLIKSVCKRSQYETVKFAALKEGLPHSLAPAAANSKSRPPATSAEGDTISASFNVKVDQFYYRYFH